MGDKNILPILCAIPFGYHVFVMLSFVHHTCKVATLGLFFSHANYYSAEVSNARWFEMHKTTNVHQKSDRILQPTTNVCQNIIEFIIIIDISGIWKKWRKSRGWLGIWSLDVCRFDKRSGKGEKIWERKKGEKKTKLTLIFLLPWDSFVRITAQTNINSRENIAKTIQPNWSRN